MRSPDIQLSQAIYWGRVSSGTITCEVGDFIIYQCQPSNDNVDVFFAQSNVTGATRIGSMKMSNSTGFACALFVATANTVSWSGGGGGYVFQVVVLRAI